MLDRRLQSIFDLVEPCECCVDIGCDHGYLALQLLVQRKANSVVAADMRELPLKSAQDTFFENHVTEGISFVLSDGIASVNEELDAAVIAGMGVDNAKKIISQDLLRFRKMKQVLVQVNKNTEEMRRWMVSQGFEIEAEKMSFIRYYYTVVRYRYTGAENSYSDFEYRFGPLLLREKPPMLVEYLKKTLSYQIELLTKIKSKPQKYKATEKLIKCLKQEVDKETTV